MVVTRPISENIDVSPASPDIAIRRQSGGPRCDSGSPLRKKLTLYGITFWVPNIKEDQIIRYLVGNGLPLVKAYGQLQISDLLPPSIVTRCVEDVYATGPTPGDHTCLGILDCLEKYLRFTKRLTLPRPALPPHEWVAGVEQARIEPVMLPPSPGDVPIDWLNWIERVAPLVPDLPPPDLPMTKPEGGPRAVWLDWIRLVVDRLPHLPPPEPLPPAVTYPQVTYQIQPVTPSQGLEPLVTPTYHVPGQIETKIPWGLLAGTALVIYALRRK